MRVVLVLIVCMVACEKAEPKPTEASPEPVPVVKSVPPPKREAHTIAPESPPPEPPKKVPPPVKVTPKKIKPIDIVQPTKIKEAVQEIPDGPDDYGYEGGELGGVVGGDVGVAPPPPPPPPLPPKKP
jgi:hypothetical protein